MRSLKGHADFRVGGLLFPMRGIALVEGGSLALADHGCDGQVPRTCFGSWFIT